MASKTKPQREKKFEDENAGSAIPLAGPAITVLAGIAAAWIAAGSTGLLSHPLRHVLTWIACASAIIASWPCASSPRHPVPSSSPGGPSSSPPHWLGPGGQSLKRGVMVLAGVVAGLMMTASALPVVNILAVALLLGVLAMGRSGVEKRVILSASIAVTVLGLYRLACTSIPFVWLASDWLGGLLGHLSGNITGDPLWVGATFAGLDFLVLMAAFYISWLLNTASPRRGRAIYGACAILAGHFLYLIVLAFASRLRAALPVPAPPPADIFTALTSPGPGWSWSSLIYPMIPWNLPLVAAMIHMAIAGAMLRWSKWLPDDPFSLSGRHLPVFSMAAGLIAVIIPVVTILWLRTPENKGKKIVVYEKGFLNWLKPVHGDYGHLSIGMYGMLPTYIESLGARCLISADLSEKDLKDADALILLYPNEPWLDGQLERIWDFVRRGGSLMVLGEHTVREPDGSNRFNEVLKPTAMSVRFDSATFEIGGWLHSYESLAHPITLGIEDERNEFGVVIGASVQAQWPARPVLIGRWGWADPGDEGNGRAMMGNNRYDAGEKLGDLILIAEQKIGAGKVIVFGDTSSMVNGITIGDHEFTSRLLSYLADGSSASGSSVGNPQATWRGVLGLLMILALIILLIQWGGNIWPIILVSVLLSISLSLCTWVGYRATEALPDGRGRSPNNLAYIDGTHAESFSSEGWRDDGIMGFSMTLMRSGYLTLMLSEFIPERLECAGLLVSIAPNRKFTRSELSMVRKFVEDGGIFIFMAGYEHPLINQQPLLSEFGLRVGEISSFREGAAPPAPISGRQCQEPLPMGFFKSPYLQEKGEMVFVRFHAAWPVECKVPDARVIAYGNDNLPVIVMRPFGRGKIVLIGDTCFAMNKNLEDENGRPFEGMYENADFWRWFLTYLKDQPPWIPPQLLRAKTESQTEKNAFGTRLNSEVTQ